MQSFNGWKKGGNPIFDHPNVGKTEKKYQSGRRQKRFCLPSWKNTLFHPKHEFCIEDHIFSNRYPIELENRWIKPISDSPKIEKPGKVAFGPVYTAVLEKIPFCHLKCEPWLLPADSLLQMHLMSRQRFSASIAFSQLESWRDPISPTIGGILPFWGASGQSL